MRIERFTWIPLVAALVVAAACSSTQERETGDTVEDEGGIVEETGEAAEAVGEGAQDVADRAEDALDDEVTVTLSPVSGSGGVPIRSAVWRMTALVSGGMLSKRMVSRPPETCTNIMKRRSGSICGPPPLDPRSRFRSPPCW